MVVESDIDDHLIFTTDILRKASATTSDGMMVRNLKLYLHHEQSK
jgi:hypothetical protein